MSLFIDNMSMTKIQRKKNDFEPNWFRRHQPYEGQMARNNYFHVERDGGDFWLRVDIPSFNRSLAIDDFLDLTAEIDRFFYYMTSRETGSISSMPFERGSICMLGTNSIQERT